MKKVDSGISMKGGSGTVAGLLHIPPPLATGMGILQIEWLTHFGRRYRHSVQASQCSDAFERLLPRVQAKIKGAVMDRYQPSAFKVQKRLYRFLRLHMDVRPLCVIGASFQQCNIERPVLVAYFFKSRKISSVATEENPQAIMQYHPGCPKRRVAVPDTATGKVLSWRCNENYPVKIAFLPPVELAHLTPVDAPIDQAITNTQRS